MCTKIVRYLSRHSGPINPSISKIQTLQKNIIEMFLQIEGLILFLMDNAL